METARAIVVIPTYNEAESLAATVAGILAEVPAASILIVDDASPDGTGDIADDLAADRRVQVDTPHAVRLETVEVPPCGPEHLGRDELGIDLDVCRGARALGGEKPRLFPDV